MTKARSFIKEPNTLLEAACKGFLATHPHLQYDESHRGACTYALHAFLSLQNLQRSGDEPVAVDLE